MAHRRTVRKGQLCLARVGSEAWSAALCVGKDGPEYHVVTFTVSAACLTTVSHVVAVDPEDFVIFVGELVARYGRVLRRTQRFLQVELFNDANERMYTGRSVFVDPVATISGEEIRTKYDDMVLAAAPPRIVCPVSKEIMRRPITVTDLGTAKLGSPMHQFTVDGPTLMQMVQSSTCAEMCGYGCAPRSIPAFVAHHAANPIVNPSLNGDAAVIRPEAAIVEDFALQVAADEVLGPDVSHVNTAAARCLVMWLRKEMGAKQHARGGAARKYLVPPGGVAAYLERGMTADAPPVVGN